MNRRELLGRGVIASFAPVGLIGDLRMQDTLSVPSKTLPRALTSPRPNCEDFWKAYLNYDEYDKGDPNAVWKLIGGSIGKSYGPKENTCAARVSYGLNYGGAQVLAFGGASINFMDQTYDGKPGDGKRYIVSAMQMAAYLREQWGAPDYELKTPEDITKVISKLGAKCAIFATPNPPMGKGHAGVLKAAYSDPYISAYLPVDAWVLP